MVEENKKFEEEDKKIEQYNESHTVKSEVFKCVYDYILK